MSSADRRVPTARAALLLALAALLVLPAAAPAAQPAAPAARPAATLPPPPPLPPLPACQVRNTRTNVLYTSLAPAVSNARAGDTLYLYGGCKGTAVTIDRNLILKGWPVSWLGKAWLIGTKGAPILRIAAGKTVRIETVRFTAGRHTKVADGGAITNAGNLTIVGAIFRANVAPYGGAIRTTGPVSVQGGSRFFRNVGLEMGGAFAVLPGGSVALTGSTIVRTNRAGNGGAAWVQGTLTMDGTTTLAANVAGRPAGSTWESTIPFAGYGGAIFLEGSLTMGPDTRIASNSALSRAGGIWWSNLVPVDDYCTTPRASGNVAALVASQCDQGTEAGPDL